MEVPPDKAVADLLKGLEGSKTPECLSPAALGQYIERALPIEESDRVEKHVAACLSCLNQLVELRELLFLEKQAEPLPLSLERSLQRLAIRQEAGVWVALQARLQSINATLRLLWNSRYAWQTATALAVASVLIIYLGLFRRGPKESVVKAPITPSEPNVATQPLPSPQANTPILPKRLLQALSGIRVGADVPRIAYRPYRWSTSRFFS